MIAICEANKMAIGIMQLSVELGLQSPRPVEMHGDNLGVLQWLANDMVSRSVKHIDVRYHAAREANRAHVRYTHVPGTTNVADIMTKPLPQVLLSRFRLALGLMEI